MILEPLHLMNGNSTCKLRQIFFLCNGKILVTCLNNIHAAKKWMFADVPDYKYSSAVVLKTLFKYQFRKLLV